MTSRLAPPMEMWLKNALKTLLVIGIVRYELHSERGAQRPSPEVMRQGRLASYKFPDLVPWEAIDSGYKIKKRQWKENQYEVYTPFDLFENVAEYRNDTLIGGAVRVVGKHYGRDPKYKTVNLCDSNFYTAFESYELQSDSNAIFNTLIISCVEIDSTKIDCIKAFVKRNRRPGNKELPRDRLSTTIFMPMGKIYKNPKRAVSLPQEAIVFFSKDYKRMVVLHHSSYNYGREYLRFIKEENLATSLD